MRASRFRWAVSILAILGTIPYITLKLSWLAGSRVGLRDPEFGHSAAMYVANTLTMLMDVVAVAMALAFVMAWGRRLPAPLVLVPMWVGTGLLAPILLVVPLQIVFGGVSAEEAAQSQPIADWVFTMVYGGFMWQGAFLLLGFVLYATQRWGYDRRAPLDVPADRVAVIVVLTLLGLAAIAQLTSPEGLTAINVLGDVAMLVVAAAGLVLLAWPGRAPRWVPITLTWLGSAAAATWGLYLLVLLLVPNDLLGDQAVGWADVLAQIVRILAGMATAVIGLRTITPRAATGSVSPAQTSRR